MTLIEKPRTSLKVPLSSLMVHLDRRDSKNMAFRISEGLKNVSRNRIVGLIQDGDWDLPTSEKYSQTLFVNTRIFHYMYRHFVLGMTWKDSKAPRKPTKLKRVERTHYSIKKEGYKSQIELGGDPAYEIEVCVGRNGQLLHRDGFHRMSSAIILDVERVHVIVNVWHKIFIDKAIKKGVELTPSKLFSELLI